MSEIDLVKADNILRLAEHHKVFCSGDGVCDISLYFLLEVYEKYVGRKATPEEISKFI